MVCQRMNSTENATMHYEEIFTAERDEQDGKQEARVVAVRKAGQARLEELRRKFVDDKYVLAVVHSPILLLPYEDMAKIFNWHTLRLLLSYLCANCGQLWHIVDPDLVQNSRQRPSSRSVTPSRCCPMRQL